MYIYSGDYGGSSSAFWFIQSCLVCFCSAAIPTQLFMNDLKDNLSYLAEDQTENNIWGRGLLHVNVAAVKMNLACTVQNERYRT